MYLAVLSLCRCVGFSPVAMHRLLIVVISLIVEDRF